MQEYCYRSSRRDATKAFVKMLVNNLRKRKISQMKQRYLHPTATAGCKDGNSKRKKRMKMRRKRDKAEANSDDSSGFHSGSSSENGDSTEAGGIGKRTGAAAAMPPTTTAAHSPAAAKTSTTAADGQEANNPDLDLTVIRQDGDQVARITEQINFIHIVYIFFVIIHLLIITSSVNANGHS
jgi:hypothetical protein